MDKWKTEYDKKEMSECRPERIISSAANSGLVPCGHLARKTNLSTFEIRLRNCDFSLKPARAPVRETLYAILGDTLQPTNPITKTIILTKINDNKFLPLQSI
jgi:hypothetical protein